MESKITTYNKNSFSLIEKIKSLFHDKHQDRDELDCTIRANALLVLGLTDETANNKETLDQRRNDLQAQLDLRISKAETSKPIQEQLTRLKHCVEVSYLTLFKGVTSATTSSSN